MNQKRIIVTGANSGKGRAVTEKLAAMGHEIIMACYSFEKASASRREIARKYPHSSLLIKIVNLDDPESILHFSDQIHNEFEGIDVLINNAGIYRETQVLNTIGIDKVFMVNTIAPIMLSLLLHDVLQRRAPSRVINSGSIGELYGMIDFDNLNGDKEYAGNRMYNQSKRALVMLSYKIALLMKKSGITVNTLQPGTLKSDRFDEKEKLSTWETIVELLLKPLTMKTDFGVDTAVYLATSPEVEGITGKYYVDMEISEPSKEAQDNALQEKLWEYVLKIISQYLPDTVKKQFSL